AEFGEPVDHAGRVGRVRFFFFSSGRRHTSWPRDWSSDVCSSDLRPLQSSSRPLQISICGVTAPVHGPKELDAAGVASCAQVSVRSEERRVERVEIWVVAVALKKKNEIKIVLEQNVVKTGEEIEVV